jgi:hypothetical protein
LPIQFSLPDLFIIFLSFTFPFQSTILNPDYRKTQKNQIPLQINLNHKIATPFHRTQKSTTKRHKNNIILKKKGMNLHLGIFCLEQEGQNQEPLGTETRIGLKQNK